MNSMSSRIRSLRRWVALLVVVPALLVLGAPHASAHTELELSAPMPGAVLDSPPTTVRLVFNEPISTPLASVVVSGPDGANHAQGPPTVTGAVLVQRLRPLPVVGTYQVGYRVVSDDGHPVIGSLSFTVTSVAGPAPALVSIPQPSLAPVLVALPAATGRDAVPLLLGATVMVVATGAILAAVAVTRARRRIDHA